MWLEIASKRGWLDVIARVAYNGTNFHGYQIQAGRSARTIEAYLKRAIETFAGGGCASIGITAVSRTDSGVSANSQMVRFRLPSAAIAACDADANRLAAELNQLLPAEIRVGPQIRFCRGSQIRIRQCVRGKQYSFFAQVLKRNCKESHAAGRTLQGKGVYIFAPQGPLDVARMARELADVIGEHDFKYLAVGETRSPSHERAHTRSPRPAASPSAEDGDEEGGRGSDAESDDDACGAVSPTVRTVRVAELSLVPLSSLCDMGLGDECAAGAVVDGAAAAAAAAGAIAITMDGRQHALRFRFEGAGFLRHQLRIAVGIALQVGEGRLAEGAFRRLFAAADAEAGMAAATAARALANTLVAARLLGLNSVPKAPGRGLVLERVHLSPGLWSDADFTTVTNPALLAEWGLPPPLLLPLPALLPAVVGGGGGGGAGEGSTEGAPEATGGSAARAGAGSGFGPAFPGRRC